MATPIMAGDVYRLVTYCWCQAQLQLGLNVHYYKASSTVGAPTDANQVDNFSLLWGADLKSVMSDQAEYRGLTLQRWMMPLPLPSSIISTVNAGVGVTAADPLPTNITGIITWQSGISGRKFRGRSYLPFPAKTASGADGYPTAGYVIALALIAFHQIPPFITTDGAGNSVGWIKQIVHGSTPAATMTNVTGGTPRKRWAQQHRRGDYGKTNATPF